MDMLGLALSALLVATNPTEPTFESSKTTASLGAPELFEFSCHGTRRSNICGRPNITCGATCLFVKEISGGISDTGLADFL